MPVNGRVDRPQRHRVLPGHRPGRRRGPCPSGTIIAAQVRIRRVDDRHRMAFGQHQPVAGRVPRVFRVPAHLVIHQHRDQMGQRQRGGRMPASRGRGHLHGQFADLDGLLVDGIFQNSWRMLRFFKLATNLSSQDAGGNARNIKLVVPHGLAASASGAGRHVFA